MSHKSTILIVDDEPVGRQLIDAILYKEGYNLEFAENGQEAYDKALSLIPDLILLDVMMPEIDGFEVCQRLRAQTSTAGVPIILVTALDDIDSRIRGLESGADDYISKPFDRLELLARVKIITRLNRYRSASGSEKGESQEAAVSSSHVEMIETLAGNFMANDSYKSGLFDDVWVFKKNFQGIGNNFYNITERDNKVAIFKFESPEKDSKDTLAYLTIVSQLKTIIESEDNWQPNEMLNKLQSFVQNGISEKKLTLNKDIIYAVSLSVVEKDNSKIMYASNSTSFIAVKKDGMTEAEGDNVDFISTNNGFQLHEIEVDKGEVLFFVPNCFYNNEMKEVLSVSFVKNILKLSLGTKLVEITGALDDIISNNKKYAEYCNQLSIVGFRI